MTHLWPRLLLCLLAVVLVGCSGLPGSEPEPVQERPLMAELESGVLVSEAGLLDVGLTVLNPGIPQEYATHRALGVFPDIRRAEAAYLPFVLRSTLEESAMWGAVRVFPESEPGTELQVSGAIVHSDGRKLTLQIRAVDATGRVWIDQPYTDLTIENDYRPGPNGLDEPFRDLYNRIANDLHAVRATLSTRDLQRIREVALLRYAGGLSPDAFDGFVQQDTAGLYQLQRLPAEDDTMLARVERIRQHEYQFIDNVDEQYSELFASMDKTYDLWRQSSQELALYQESYRERAASRENKAQRGSYEALKQTYNNYRWARIQEQDAEEIARGFNNEVQPTVMEIEGRVVRLTGTLDDQYGEWRRILRSIFELETGLPARPVE